MSRGGIPGFRRWPPTFNELNALYGSVAVSTL
jgi:hypothetical protein